MSALDARRAVVVRRLVITAGLCVLAVIAVYLLFVCTRRGQDFDDGAYAGRDAVRPAATRATDRLLGSVTSTSLAVLGTGLVLVALLRGRWRLAVGVVVAIGGAILTAEVLKELLPRHDYPGIQGIPQNSYPSGHATVAVALALGLVMVSPRRLRAVAGVLAALFATAVGMGVLASGWHRPSDSLGAFGVTLGWFAAVTAVLVAWRGTGPEHDHDHDHLDEAPPAAVVVGAVALLAAVVLGIRRTIDRSDTLVAVHFRLGYVLACIAIATVGVAVVAAYVLLLEGTTLDPPSASTRGPRPGVEDLGP